MKLLTLCVVALAASAPAFTQTGVPAAPSVTAGAEFKGLRLDWDPVAGATSYRLEYRAHQNAPFVQQGAIYPASVTLARFRLPLHLFDWTYARYRVAACNSTGCSFSPEVSVSLLRRDAVGYFKPDQNIIGMGFGADVDLSPDGLNFVSATPGDFLSSDKAQASGAVYVFRRGSGGAWFQRARLLPTNPPFIEGLNILNVAMSADGNTVALGMPNYWHEEIDPRSGEVFVFHFDGTSWVRTRLPAIARGAFGRWVALNDAGDILAVARGEFVEPPVPHRVDIYRLANGKWTVVRSIDEEGCGPGVLSGDGSMLAQACSDDSHAFVRTLSGPNWTVRQDLPLELPQTNGAPLAGSGIGIDATGDTIAAQVHLLSRGPDPDTGPSEVHVFRRVAGMYSKVAALVPGPWRMDERKNSYGFNIAPSNDGSTLVVGDTWDNGLGTGPRAAPLNPGDTPTGGVYVYRFSNTWRLVNVVKPNFLNDRRSFADELALSGNGQTLIVGERAESSNAEGIGGDWANTASPQSGAVWMY